MHLCTLGIWVFAIAIPSVFVAILCVANLYDPFMFLSFSEGKEVTLKFYFECYNFKEVPLSLVEFRFISLIQYFQ